MLNLTLTDDSKLYASLSFNTPIPFTLIGQEYSYQIDNLRNLKCLEEFVDYTRFETKTRLLKREWRLSLDGINWSTWISMFETKYNTSNIPDKSFYEEIGSVKIPDDETVLNKLAFGELIDMDTKQTYHIQIKWTRIGSESDGAIFLDGFNLLGWWDRDTVYSPVINLTGSDYVYYRVPEVWKVFKLTDFEILSDGLSSTRTLSVDYRITQDSGRSWTNWESLTKGNVSTLKFTPIRFFNIEYRIKRTGDTTGNIFIYEINLLGDFQNVTQDYYKSNKMGIRECCCLDNNTQISVGNGPQDNSGSTNGSGTPQTGSEGLLMSSACIMPDIYTNPLGSQNLDALFKPYQLDQAVQLYNALSTITTQVFGFDVVYFLTAPEKNGTDYTFHEYQLFNVKCTGDIKVSVDDNQFPDNQVVFNQFDLSLFESFEIHITKETFWKVFGIDERPSKEDFLWFCNLNRIYQVEHAQSYRDFNNSSVFWKVILKKYNQKGNIIPSSSTVEDRIAQLINNTTMDELMGVEKTTDKEDVAFKDQHLTLSQDTIRYEFFVPITREIIDNSTLLVARDHYDLSGVDYGSTAITYRKADNVLQEGNNRSFTFWFQLTNFIITEITTTPSLIVSTGLTGPSHSTIYTYSYTGSTIFTNSYINPQENNLITNYDSGYNKGYKVSIYNKNEIKLDINSDSYSLPLSATGLTGSIWYCYHVNMNQREKYVEHFLYKRNSDENLSIRLKSPKLMLLNSLKQTMNNVNQFENTNGEIRINGSDMKLTNIRIWDDIVIYDNHTKVLNQNIVKDYSHIILADSANKKVTGLDNIPYN